MDSFVSGIAGLDFEGTGTQRQRHVVLFGGSTPALFPLESMHVVSDTSAT
jgi:hypothetical protein